MNKNILFSIFISCLFSTCKTIPSQGQTFHPIVQKAKETSLYTQQINWKEVNKTFLELLQENKPLSEQTAALQYLINSLGDKHASIRSSKDYSVLVSYTGERAGEENVNPNFINTVINDVNATFSYQLLNDQIGYLKVVGIGPGVLKEQADLIRQGLVELKAKGVEKWIVDLRYNGGGNIEPMIAGLAPLIGDGFIGGAINNQNVIREFTIENAQFSNWGRIVCEMENLPLMKQDEKVAILMSRYTISSGEMLAITFKERKNTRFFGEASAGYTTGNGFDPIGEDFILNISQDIFIDRTKKRYNQNVPVDEFIEFQHNTTLENDLQIERAIEWLKEK